MGFDELLDGLPDYARDVRLNARAVLSDEGGLGLDLRQRLLIALASAYATKSREVVEGVLERAAGTLGDADVTAAKGAATVMAMNNVYYRFLHVGVDDDIKRLPARLRMNFIGKPGVAKTDFELACLAVSAINGCGACMTAHVNEARAAGVPAEGVQTTVRIASAIAALAQAHFIR